VQPRRAIVFYGAGNDPAGGSMEGIHRRAWWRGGVANGSAHTAASSPGDRFAEQRWTHRQAGTAMSARTFR
jgi:hypothetical protein